jgi:hypothetical protein
MNQNDNEQDEEVTKFNNVIEAVSSLAKGIFFEAFSFVKKIVPGERDTGE